MIWSAVALVGGFVGLAELLSRYRDAPFDILSGRGAWLYIAVNVLASLLALALFDVFGQSLVSGMDTARAAATRFLVAGFGSIALLRSALFKLRVDQSDVSIGPAAMLETLLRVCDREVDRNRAMRRAERVPKLMARIPAAHAWQELPGLCLALMQNLSADEQKTLGEQIRLIAEDKGPSEMARAVNAGLLLSRFVGLEVLDVAVQTIETRLRETGAESLVQDGHRALAGDAGPPPAEILADLNEDRAAGR